MYSNNLRIMAKKVVFKARPPEFKSLPCRLLAVYPWTRHFTLYSEDFSSVRIIKIIPGPKKVVIRIKGVNLSA